MKKNIFITIILLIVSNTVFSQLKVFNDGSVHINSYAGNWGHSMYTTVHYPQSCAYHLRYNNKDRFYVNAEGWLWCEKGGWFGSDYKIKKNINKIQSPLSTIKLLNGIQFDYIDTINYNLDFKDYSYKKLGVKPNVQRIGLIAQEVEMVLPGIVKTLADSTKAISYTDIIAILIEAMKEQQTQIETLQMVIYSQEQEIVSIKKAFDKCCSKDDNQSRLKSSSINNETYAAEGTISESAKLFDNVPNPFSINTEIKFEIPKNSNSAKLIIHDMQGIELKSFNITQKGIGSITINSSELKAGMYLYTLLIDNRIIDTKRMLLTKE